MFKPYQIYIGLRYLRAKRRNQFISFISLITILGIFLGVTALITVLSVMNGFETELRERILGMASHVTVSGYDGQLGDWQKTSEILVKNNTRIVGIAPYISAQGMLTSGQQVHGTFIRGILPNEEPKVSDVGDKVLIGSLSDLVPGKYNVMLGKGLASSLGVIVGDKVTMVTPQALSTPAGILPRLKRFVVSGIFEVGHNDYDTSLAVMHMDDAAKLFRMKNNVTGVRIKLDDLFEATKVRYELAQFLDGNYWVSDWTRQHANFFRAVKIEKRMMFLILLLIVTVAAFNIVSTIVMVVRDKQSDIAILRTLGATPKSIMVIFIVQGAVIGVLGTLFGALGGIGLALNVETIVPAIEGLFGVQFMPADVYYISEFPSELHWEDVTQITIISFIISLVATLWPAWNASRTQPAEALRYE